MIPTAEEFINGHYNEGLQTQDFMIEFAKLHVEAALKEVCNKVEIIDDPNSYCGNTGSEYLPDQIVSSKSIINAYPLTNIK